MRSSRGPYLGQVESRDLQSTRLFKFDPNLFPGHILLRRMAQGGHGKHCSRLDHWRIEPVRLRFHSEANLYSEVCRELRIIPRSTADIERKQITELQNIGQPFQFFCAAILSGGKLPLPEGLSFQKSGHAVTVIFRDF